MFKNEWNGVGMSIKNYQTTTQCLSTQQRALDQRVSSIPIAVVISLDSPKEIMASTQAEITLKEFTDGPYREATGPLLNGVLICASLHVCHKTTQRAPTQFPGRCSKEKQGSQP